MALELRGIKLKLTLAVILSVVVASIALTAVTNLLVSITYDLSLKERRESTSKMIHQALAGQQRQLRGNLELVTQDPQFQQDVSFHSWDHITADLDKLRDQAHCAAATVVYLKNVVAQSSPDKKLGAQLLTRSAAAQQVDATGKTTVTIETIDGETLQIVATPIILLEQNVGYLVAASVIDQSLLAQLKEASGADVLLVRDGKVVAGTCPLDDAGPLAGLDRRFSGDDLVNVDGSRSNGQPLLASAIPLRTGGNLHAALVFALSSKDATAIRKRVTLASIALSIVITLLCGVIGLFVARRISDPIVEIEQSFHEIAASGDLSRRITKQYPDEVGRMAASFNQMQEQIESLHERVVKAEQRMRSELKMASAVQEMLLPSTTVEGAHCIIASYGQTSTETGGDWHTVIHSPENQSSTIILADVTGHGAPSALVTAVVHGYFNAVRDQVAAAGSGDWQATMTALLNALNKVIIDSTHRSLVMSLCVLAFDHRTRTARFLNAGHLAPIIAQQSPQGPRVSLISLPPSSLVGDLDVPNFALREFSLQPGDVFLLYTDGLVECENSEGEQYGLKRLRQVILKNAAADARSVRDLVQSNLSAYLGSVPPADDITFVVGRVR